MLLFVVYSLLFELSFLFYIVLFENVLDDVVQSVVLLIVSMCGDEVGYDIVQFVLFGQLWLLYLYMFLLFDDIEKVCFCVVVVVKICFLVLSVLFVFVLVLYQLSDMLIIFVVLFDIVWLNVCVRFVLLVVLRFVMQNISLLIWLLVELMIDWLLRFYLFWLFWLLVQLLFVLLVLMVCVEIVLQLLFDVNCFRFCSVCDMLLIVMMLIVMLVVVGMLVVLQRFGNFFGQWLVVVLVVSVCGFVMLLMCSIGCVCVIFCSLSIELMMLLSVCGICVVDVLVKFEWFVYLKCMSDVLNVVFIVLVVLLVEISSWFGVILIFVKLFLCRQLMIDFICVLVGVQFVRNCLCVRYWW